MRIRKQAAKTKVLLIHHTHAVYIFPDAKHTIIDFVYSVFIKII